MVAHHRASARRSQTLHKRVIVVQTLHVGDQLFFLEYFRWCV